MKISAIQNQVITQPKPIAKQVIKQKFNNPNPNEQTQQVTPSFKGNGNGMLAGLGGGLIAGLIVIGGSAITGGLALPALIGGAGVVGSGVVGAVIGDKIEDAIKGKKD